jgi:hypothetical protein
MTTYIGVSFLGLPRDLSIEAAIHRWVARLEAIQIEVQRAQITVQPSGRKRTRISATVQLVNGDVKTSAIVHENAYVGIADTFRAIRQHTFQQVLPRRAACA